MAQPRQKNGKLIYNDCYAKCSIFSDGYDETHAMLSSDIFKGLRMRNLTRRIKTSTFVGFPGSPIDNIYAGGASTLNFTGAVKHHNSFGSDHYPVYTVWSN